MRALVVYESMFGNTAQVAWAIADGLREHLPTDVVEVGPGRPVTSTCWWSAARRMRSG